MTKVCTKCNETKPFELFNKKAGRKDGRASACRECSTAYSRACRANRSDEQRAKDYAYSGAWKAANPDLVRQHKRTAYHKHRERELENSKKWRDANKGWIQNYNAEYHAQNKDQIRERKRAWRIANPELRNQRERICYAANPEVRRKASKVWRDKNIDAVRQQANLRGKRYRETFADTYVNNKLRRGLRLKGVKMPPELIELKRAHLQIKRELKEKLA
jgi:hypothetical protein